MKKLFLTSGVILCMACPALADPLDITTTTNDNDQYLLTDNTAANCSTPKTLKYDNAPTTFYAKWTKHQYKVTYHGGTAKTSDFPAGHAISGTIESPAVFDTNYTVLANTDAAFEPLNGAAFAQTGYHFTGWRANNNIVTPTATPLNTDFTANGTEFQPGATPMYKVVGDVDMYAQWAPDEYNMIYDSGAHGKSSTAQSPAHNATYTDPTKIVYDMIYTVKAFGDGGAGFEEDEGYTFQGWSFDADADPVEDSASLLQAGAMSARWTQASGDTLYAIYSANNWDLVYDCGQYNSNRVANPVAGQALATSLTYPRTYDAPAAALLDPRVVCELGGYHVAAGTTWSCVKTATNETVDLADIAGTWKVDANVTCTASWTPNTIGLAWDAGAGATAQNGGEYSAGTGTDTCTYDLGINVGAAPKKAGYDFQGWTTSTTVPQGAGYEVFPSETAPTPGTTVSSAPAVLGD